MPRPTDGLAWSLRMNSLPDITQTPFGNRRPSVRVWPWARPAYTEGSRLTNPEAEDLYLKGRYYWGTTAYGYAREELIGMPIKNLRAASGVDAFDMQWQELQEQESRIFETVHRRKDASTFPVEVSARRIVVEGTAFRQSIIRDTTE